MNLLTFDILISLQDTQSTSWTASYLGTPHGCHSCYLEYIHKNLHMLDPIHTGSDMCDLEHRTMFSATNQKTGFCFVSSIHRIQYESSNSRINVCIKKVIQSHYKDVKCDWIIFFMHMFMRLFVWMYFYGT